MWTRVRPLVTRLLGVPAYRAAYEDKLRALIAGPFSQAVMDAEIDRVYNLIQADVYNDTMKDFTNQEFEDSIDMDLPDWTSDGRLFGLKPMVGFRSAAVIDQLP
jgi:hypothetical protein